ncbi:hypothetical protein OROGR_033314 [Orobanche gracilis]
MNSSRLLHDMKGLSFCPEGIICCQSIMPQLDKFTYFTQFFWFCLFLLTFYIIVRFFPFDSKIKIFCLYLTRPKLQRALSLALWLIVFYVLTCSAFRLYNNLTSFVLLHSVLPFDPGSSGVSSGWTDLLDPATSSSGTGSVNQPPEGMPVPPANPVAPGEADIRPVVAYPYMEDEMIGGQSVLDIRTRLLRSKAQPSAEEIDFAHINAQDRFEIKVDIIQQMAVLDPSGDWTGRGARALDNPRAVRTGGEPSLIELYRLRDELHEGGVQSDAFLRLKDKIFTRVDNLDENSTT